MNNGVIHPFFIGRKNVKTMKRLQQLLYIFALTFT